MKIQIHDHLISAFIVSHNRHKALNMNYTRSTIIHGSKLCFRYVEKKYFGFFSFHSAQLTNPFCSKLDISFVVAFSFIFFDLKLS